MQESGFYISARQGHFVIRGGKLWQAPKLEEAWGAQLQDKKLIISFRPGDTLEEVFTSLRKQIRQISWRLSLRLFASALLTPLVLVLPAIILIVFIGTVGAYGNLINELISAEGGGNAMTHLGITKYKLFFIQTTIYIVGAYAFPLFFQGDYDDTISRFKKLTDNQQIMKARLQKALKPAPKKRIHRPGSPLEPQPRLTRKPVDRRHPPAGHRNGNCAPKPDGERWRSNF
jgi:hypothetical protein